MIYLDATGAAFFLLLDFLDDETHMELQGGPRITFPCRVISFIWKTANASRTG